MKKLVVQFLPCFILAIATVCGYSEVTIRRVAAFGEAAPGTESGTLFSSFSPWGISTNGRVAFSATVSGPAVGPGLTNSVGNWRHDGSNAVLLGRAGDLAPGTSGRFMFLGLGPNQNISPQGEQAMTWRVLGPGFASTNDLGIWTAAAGSNSLRLVVRNGTPASGASGNFGSFGGVDGFAYNFVVNNGRLAFRGATVGPAKNGVWLEQGGVLGALAVEDDLPPGGYIPNDKFASFFTPRMNANGVLYFAAVVNPSTNGVDPNNDSGIWRWNGAALSLSVREGTPAPGVPGGNKFYQPLAISPAFTRLTMNRSGQIAFVGQLTGTVNGIVQPQGIWSGDPGSLNLIALLGDPAPGTEAGTVFSNNFTAIQPVLINSGDTFFRAAVTGALVSVTNDIGIWRHSPTGGLSLVVREGQPAPGIPPECDSRLLNIRAFTANNQGQVAFLGAITNASTTAREALWAQNANGVFELVAMVGQPMEIRPGQPGLVTDLIVPGEISAADGTGVPAGEDGQPTIFNDEGELLFRADFSSPTSGPPYQAVYVARLSTNCPAQANTAANFLESAMASPRINAFTGELIQDPRADLFIDGPLALYFSRYYASNLQRDGNNPGRLGANWLHTFEWRLKFIATNHLHVVNNRGRALCFERSPTNWNLVAPKDVPYQLVYHAATTNFFLGDPILRRSYAFDCAGRLRRVVDDATNQLVLTYRDSLFNPPISSPIPGGLLSFVTNVAGHGLQLHYNTNGLLERVADVMRTNTYGYDLNGNLVVWTNAMGHPTRYGYDTAHAVPGLMTNCILPEGNSPWRWTWDASGRISSECDGLGNVWSFTKQQGTTPAGLSGPGNPPRQFRHNDKGQLVQLTDERGKSAHFAYDAEGRRALILDRLGDTQQIIYHEPSGRLEEWVDANGEHTTAIYVGLTNFAGLAFYYESEVAHPDGTFDSYAYNDFGDLTNFVDRAGKFWNFQYRVGGLQTNSLNPDGGRRSWSYNTAKLATNTVDHFTNVTAYTYDALNRLIRIRFPDGSTNAYIYDANDNVLSIRDGRTNLWTLSYDRNRNLIARSDPRGQLWTNSYDVLDRINTLTDPRGQSVIPGYDSLGRLITYRDRNTNTVIFTYDPAHRLTALTDAAGKTTTRTLDDENVATAAQNPAGEKTIYQTDDPGRLKQITSNGGQTMDLFRDTMGRLVGFSDFLDQETTFDRDTRGQVATTTVARGSLDLKSMFERNSLGQITNTVDADGFTWAKDRDPQGRIRALRDPNGNSTAVGYNGRGLVASLTLPGGMGSATCLYDGNANLVSVSFSDGTTFTNTYDERNLLVAANQLALAYDENARVTNSNGLGIDYDGEGRITRVTFEPGKFVTYTYDARNTLVGITDWLGGTNSFVHDDAGRLTTVTRPNGVPTRLYYNGDGEVTNITHGLLGDIRLKRDFKGQITRTTRTLPLQGFLPAAAKSNSYDAASQLNGMGYNAMGCVTNDGVRDYTWDLAGRLRSYTQGATTVLFTNDMPGHLVSRTEAGVNRQFVWNYAYDLEGISIERTNGAAHRYYIHTPGGALLYFINANNSQRRFYHHDENGHVAFITDAAGLPDASYAYDPFGRVLAASGSVVNVFTWLGGISALRDGTNQIYLIGNRWYDALTARHLCRDPVPPESPAGINPYPLVDNAPPQMFGARGFFEVVSPWKLAGGLRSVASRIVSRELSEVKTTIQIMRDRYFASLVYNRIPSDSWRAAEMRARIYPYEASQARLQALGTALRALGFVIAAGQEAANSQNTTWVGTAIESGGVGAGSLALGAHPAAIIAGAVSSIADNVTDGIATFAEVDIKAPKALEVYNNGVRSVGVLADVIIDSTSRGQVDATSAYRFAKEAERKQGSLSAWLVRKGQPLADSIFDAFTFYDMDAERLERQRHWVLWKREFIPSEEREMHPDE